MDGSRVDPGANASGEDSHDLMLSQFQYGSQSVRTIIIDGEPWFVAADVCAVLGLSNVTEALRGLDEDEFRTTEVIDTAGRRQQMYVVNEPGLYSLILRSRKPEAKAFKRWITHEVLPALRKTGSYTVPAIPDIRTPKGLLVMVEQFRETVLQLVAAETRNAELAPKAESWDVLASAEGDYSVGDAAKILSRDPAIKLGERRLFTVLNEQRWTYRQRGDRRWRAAQTAVEARRLSEIPSTHYHPRTGQLIADAPQVRVTAKGMHDLHRLLGGTGPLRLADGDQLQLA